MNKSRGRPFQSGNQYGRGRPKGSRNKTTVAARALLDQHAEALTRKCIIEALQGNPHAMRVCMERITPARREAPVRMKLPLTGTAGAVDRAEQTVVQQIARGRLTPGEGETCMNVLEMRRKSIEMVDLAGRIERLERAEKEPRAA